MTSLCRVAMRTSWVIGCRTSTSMQSMGLRCIWRIWFGILAWSSCFTSWVKCCILVRHWFFRVWDRQIQQVAVAKDTFPVANSVLDSRLVDGHTWHIHFFWRVCLQWLLWQNYQTYELGAESTQRHCHQLSHLSHLDDLRLLQIWYSGQSHLEHCLHLFCGIWVPSTAFGASAKSCGFMASLLRVLLPPQNDDNTLQIEKSIHCEGKAFNSKNCDLQTQELWLANASGSTSV